MYSGYVFPLYADETLTAPLHPEAFKIMILHKHQPKQFSITCLKVDEVVLDFFIKLFPNDAI